EEAVDRGLAGIERLLSRNVEKERMTEDEKTAVLNRLTTSTNLEESSKDVDLVIEAAIENVDIKKDIFRQLDEYTKEEAILATNTSSLPITDIASVTNRPEKVIGMHFMNPVPVMKLVEIIRAIQTSDETYETIAEMTKKLNKTSVESNDFPGFIANRILMPMINEAIYTVYE